MATAVVISIRGNPTLRNEGIKQQLRYISFFLKFAKIKSLCIGYLLKKFLEVKPIAMLFSYTSTHHISRGTNEGSIP